MLDGDCLGEALAEVIRKSCFSNCRVREVTQDCLPTAARIKDAIHGFPYGAEMISLSPCEEAMIEIRFEIEIVLEEP